MCNTCDNTFTESNINAEEMPGTNNASHFHVYNRLWHSSAVCPSILILHSICPISSCRATAGFVRLWQSKAQSDRPVIHPCHQLLNTNDVLSLVFSLNSPSTPTSTSVSHIHELFTPGNNSRQRSVYINIANNRLRAGAQGDQRPATKYDSESNKSQSFM